MEPELKTQILIGTLAAAVLGAAGYGLYQESKRPGAGVPGRAPGGGKASQAETQAAPAGLLRIETIPLALGDSAGHEARVIGKPGLRYEWEIKGGKLESGADRDTVTWTAGPSDGAVLTCRGFDAEGTVYMGSIRVPIKAEMRIAEFAAAPPVITQGATAKLGWTVRNCRKLVLDPGGREVTDLNGPGLDVNPAETAVYTLRATDESGAVITREVTLKVVPAPQISALRAEAKAGSPGAFTVIGEFKGGKAELKEGETVLASAGASPLQAELSAPKAGASVTLVVTNEAGTTVRSALGFSAPPAK